MATATLDARPAASSTLVAPMFGLVVAASFVGASLVGGSGEPAADASAAKAAAYWSEHANGQMAASALFAVSSASLVVFAGALREALANVSDRLARVAWAGCLIAATGILTLVSITFTAADTAGDVDPAMTQTLSALNQDFFFPMATGFGLMMLAGGLVALRAAGPVRWFGGISILLGVLAFTPAGIVVFYATPVWIAVVSLALILRPAPVRRAA